MERFNPTDSQLAYLQAGFGTTPYRHMARELGVCVDTLKRILVRHAIADFEPAKYVAADSQIVTWTRPCIDCADTKPRPKNWYFCPSCRRQRGYEDVTWSE